VRSYIKKSHSDLIFLLLQAILYIAFLFLDLTGRSTAISAGIKYTMILLCFCYALFYGSAGKSIVFIMRMVHEGHRSLFNLRVIREGYLSIFLLAGLFFTLVSDLFILLLDQYFYGVLTFLIVQQFYAFRLLVIREELDREESQENTRSQGRYLLFLFLKRLLLQLSISAVICFGLTGAGVAMEDLLIASVLYFICILTNTASAVRVAFFSRKRYHVAGHDTIHLYACAGDNNQLYAAGMILFLLCDINVGLFNLSGFIAMPQELYSLVYEISGILMWTFYAPSQVLIALSSCVRVRLDFGKITENP
jgi:hypothetical protein